MSVLRVKISPTGIPSVSDSPDGLEVPAELAQALLESSTPGEFLLRLGLFFDGQAIGEELGFFRAIAQKFFHQLCEVGNVQKATLEKFALPLEVDEALRLITSAPPMLGFEYLTSDSLKQIWQELGVSLFCELEKSGESLNDYLRKHGSLWNIVGRVYFHLAENKHDEQYPFAFLATYTTQISQTGKLQHLPLGKALASFEGNNQAMLSLLTPVQKATEKSALLLELVESSKIYYPQKWTPSQAYAFLTDLAFFEEVGISTRVPNWWSKKNRSRPTVEVTLGDRSSGGVGLSALMDFSVELSLNGETFTQAELEELLKSGASGLTFLRGNWVEVDSAQLNEVLTHWEKLKNKGEGISFLDGIRLLAGVPDGKGDKVINDYVQVSSGEWFSKILNDLKNPPELDLTPIREKLKATLRPYQEDGLRWLWLMDRLGLGGCLADDMGLGKTLQILALLVSAKFYDSGSRIATLLVVPASLIGNWISEQERFAPELKTFVAHPSETPLRELQAISEKELYSYDIVITTYSMLTRLDWITRTNWSRLIIDEAQAIKNAESKQSKVVKEVRCEKRFALTGTPVENRVGDLWSLFQFLNPGLLGSATQFGKYLKNAKTKEENPYPAIRKVIRPFILRRVKTDKQIISDLPDKVEQKVYCGLTKEQAGIYQKLVIELSNAIETSDAIKRRGIVLSYLIRFKQLCNHPSHLTGHGDYRAESSGKFMQLREICQDIQARQEKVLIFTQFREITEVLSEYLRTIFNQPGLILHGDTRIKDRQKLVQQFQSESGAPFFVLSLKAGGTGLNLTAASHVIHFDRWWNPAVENQATDRAFRIGQKKNVLVHKLICRGTLEEKIDELIESKRQISEELLQDGGQAPLTELSNAEILKLVSLDTQRAFLE